MSFNKLVLALPFLVVFIASIFQPYDTDLGWHLKYGEYFVNNHEVLRENTFSTMMPDYHWPNSSWGTDVISYVTFSTYGFIGLSILAATIITITFYFFSKASKLTIFEQSLIFPIILHLIHPVNMVSFRGQLLSLMFIGIITYIFSIYEENKNKKILLTIPLFLIWSNIHGQFLLGLGIFALWIFFYFVKNALTEGFKLTEFKKEALFLSTVLISSALAVLINPFGLEVYKEAIRHFGNPLQKYILEWLPFEEQSTFWWYQIVAGLLVFFGLLFIALEGKIKEKISQVGIFTIFYALSFLIRRFSWPMYYLSMPLMQPVANFFKPDHKKNEIATAIIILLTYISFVFVLDSPYQRFKNLSWQGYCNYNHSCPEGALKYLENNKPQGKLLTFYDWGGYIIWKHSQIKPSIDGRMHLWRDENNYSAFEDYFDIEQNMANIENTDYTLVLMSPKKPLYTRMVSLVEVGKWNILYKDNTSAIFQKNKNL